MTPRAVLLLLTSSLMMARGVQAQTAPPAPPASPFYVEAADCTAALEARVRARLTQNKSDARDKAILADTELGFTFVGVAYKQGLRNPQADDLLDAAHQRWRQLPRTEQDSRQALCTTRARKLMSELTFVERFIVRNRAKARVERLLEKEAAR